MEYEYYNNLITAIEDLAEHAELKHLGRLVSDAIDNAALTDEQRAAIMDGLKSN